MQLPLYSLMSGRKPSSFGWSGLILLPFTVAVVAACAGPLQTSGAPTLEVNLVDPQLIPTSSIEDPVLREGEANYQKYCAHCHSYEGQGQAVSAPGDTERLGMKVVPPLNSTGSAWRYADQLLLQVVRDGIQNPLNHYPMPPWSSIMTDEQIMGVLSYIKLWWSDEQRQHQAQVTANLAQARQALGMEIILMPEMEATPQ